MASNFNDNETNEQSVDEYCDQDEDDLSDFIVDDDDEPLKHHQQELEDEVEEEVEEGEGIEEDEVEEEVEEGEGIEEDEVEEELEEGEGIEEEEEEEPIGQQEVLSLREQLKEEIRRKNAAMSASASKPNSSSKHQTMPPIKDGYGTFFGPSKPVLARRVIEEGCSSMMKDLQNLPSKKEVNLASKMMRPGAVENNQKLNYVSEEKRKVDTLRKNRDYSCLFSDDADAQPPTKDHPAESRGPIVLKSESQVRGPVNSAAGKRRVLTGQPAASSSTDHGLKGSGSLGKKAHAEIKGSSTDHGSKSSGSPGKKAHAEIKGTIATGRNGFNMFSLKKKSPGLLSSSKGQMLQPSLRKRPQASIAGQKLRQQSQNQRPLPQNQRPQGNGRQPPLQGRRLQDQHIGQNRSAEQNGKLKSAQKQIAASSKLMASRPIEKCAVKRRKSIDYRQMNNYEEVASSDEDESDMEADFASIQREERRSAALARKEDEEQLQLIREEEKRERAMKRKRAARKE